MDAGAYKPNYISVDEDESAFNHRARRSKRLMRQHQIGDRQDLHRIVVLVANKLADVLDLEINCR